MKVEMMRRRRRRTDDAGLSVLDIFGVSVHRSPR